MTKDGTATPSSSAPPPEGLLAPREAYRLWAPVYAETPITFVDEGLVAPLTPPLAGLRVLDAGCGTGRRLQSLSAAARVAGTDLSWEMLSNSEAVKRGERPALAAADVRALPFADATFDLVWCRLVVGHLPSAVPAYAELGRVCAPGGTVIVTDFHPAAAGNGQVRTFRDTDGVLHTVEHHIHPQEAQVRAAGDAGLELIEARDGLIGPELRPFFERANQLARYPDALGMPVVLALVFRRRP
jgi:SAM-dependent methyltransferase